MSDVRANRVDAVKSGLRAGRYDACATTDGVGNTALHLAAEKGLAHMAQILTEETK